MKLSKPEMRKILSAAKHNGGGEQVISKFHCNRWGGVNRATEFMKTRTDPGTGEWYAPLIIRVIADNDSLDRCRAEGREPEVRRSTLCRNLPLKHIKACACRQSVRGSCPCG